uniref:Conserved domain protein n=1 Tax=Heterorhabditis bacteriophora TaxID=37862 RepID=A0A1I7WJ67_HETBA
MGKRFKPLQNSRQEQPAKSWQTETNETNTVISEKSVKF